MSEYLLINASPRKQGTSVVLLEQCKAFLASSGHKATLLHLYPALQKPQELVKSVGQADTIVICGPCYINTYPAETIALLDILAANPEALHGQSMYGMIQGGMPYVHTHESGLKMLDMFCRKRGLSYKGGFVMGFGAFLNGRPVAKLPHARKVQKHLNLFFSHIEKNENSKADVYEDAQLRLPGFLAGIMAGVMNRQMKKDLKKHGIDINEKSPYLSVADAKRIDAQEGS